MSPHTGDTTSAPLHDDDMCGKVRAISSDNASDVCTLVSKVLNRAVDEGHSSLFSKISTCAVSIISLTSVLRNAWD